jgi:hypothetical protein
MPEINLGENYRIEEDDNGDLVIHDTGSDTVIARHDRDEDQWTDGSEEQIGGGGNLASLSDVHKQSEEPSDPSDDDIWFVTR